MFGFVTTDARAGVKDALSAVVRVRRWPIGAQLFLLALSAAIPALVAMALVLKGDWNAAIEQSYARAQVVAERASSEIDGTVRDFEAVLFEISHRPQIRSLDPSRCDPILRSLGEVHKELTAITVRAADSTLVCSSLGTATMRLPPDQSMLVTEAVTTNRLRISNSIVGPSSGKWVAALYYPIRDDVDEPMGVVIAALDLVEFSRRLFSGVADDVIVSVLDGDLNVAMRSRDLDQWIGKRIPPRITEFYSDGGNQHFRLVDLAGIPRIGAYVNGRLTNWIVAAAISEREALGPYRLILINNVIAGVAALALLAILLLWLANGMVRPIRDLAQVSHDVTVGQAGVNRPGIAGGCLI
jgi:hypothetical protein